MDADANGMGCVWRTQSIVERFGTGGRPFTCLQSSFYQARDEKKAPEGFWVVNRNQWKCSFPAGVSSGISACTSSPLGSANSGAPQSSQYSAT